MKQPQKYFQNFNLIVIWPILTLFNLIQPKQPLDKYERAGIQFWPENKSGPTQLENLKNIINLNPYNHRARDSPI